MTGLKKTIKILCILTLGPWLLGAAEKVASLSPALTQMVLLLDGGSALCGRSSACYFPEVSGVPVVGDLGRPFPEAVLQSRATVVICDTLHPEANWAILQRCGVKIERFTTANIAKNTFIMFAPIKIVMVAFALAVFPIIKKV